MEAELIGLAIALIVVLAADATACVQPIAYIRADLERLGCTPTQMKVIPAVKFLAVAGLIVGLWVPALGVAACLGMILYLGVAVGFHARANDTVVQYLPAVGFAVFFGVVLALSYLPAV